MFDLTGGDKLDTIITEKRDGRFETPKDADKSSHSSPDKFSQNSNPYAVSPGKFQIGHINNNNEAKKDNL